MTDDELIREIEAQRDLMVAVATGGPEIKSVNAEYRERRERIARGLRERGITDPNSYSDLWRWYGYWSTHLSNWASRRGYIAELYDLLIDQIRNASASTQVFEEPTGWERVDRGIGKARRDLQVAQSEEEFQAVGLHCREVLISLAQVIFDPDEHLPVDEELPSDTDAKRRLDAYFASTLAGPSSQEARAVAKSAVKLALAVQHKRTATFRDAALCLEAANSVVNIAAVLEGRRGGEIEDVGESLEDIPF